MRKRSLISIFYLCLLWMLPALAWAQTPPDIEIDVLGTCLPANPQQGSTASTKFFARYPTTPDSVLWNFGTVDPNTGDSLTSRQLQPIVTFPQAGNYPVQLVVWNDGISDTIPTLAPIQQNEQQLQIMDQDDPSGEPKAVSGELVLCPGDTRTLQAQVQAASGGGSGGGGGQQGGTPAEVNWFRPQSADGDNPVVSATEITIGTDTTADGKYKDAGTYFVVYNEGGCPIYQSFRVVIYNEEDQNNSRWYFGDGAGIDFKTGMAISTGAMAGGEAAVQGNAIVGDANADVLFLTNGETLWYGNEVKPAMNGDAVGGSREVSQNSLFVDFAGDETLFYLFTIDEAGELAFSTLDLKTDTLPGVAVSAEERLLNDIALHEQVTEKLTSASRDSGGGWVVAHELNSNAFLSYPVTQDGIDLPVISNVGSTHTNGTGYMRISDSGILATTVNEGGSSYIELFRFHPDSGTVTNPLRLEDLPFPSGGTVYGLEFAGDRLYATVKTASTSYLYQYTVDSTLNKESIEASRVASGAISEELGALQLGPDQALYIARNGSSKVFKITGPTDSLPSLLPINENYDFELIAGTQSTLGLPNFGENAGMSVPEAEVMVATPSCFGDDVLVFGQQRYSNDMSLNFYFFKNSVSGDTIHTAFQNLQQGQGIPGAPADPPSLPFSVYEQHGPGTYYVKMTITNPCGTYPAPGEEPIIAEFIINPKPEAIVPEGQNLLLCDEQSVTIEGFAKGGSGSQSADTTRFGFQWLDMLAAATPVQPNDHIRTSGNTLTVDTAGVWGLVVIDFTTGCSSDTVEVEVRDNRPKAELGDDVNVCVGTTLSQSLDAGFTNASDFTFAWFLNGRNLNNSGTSQPLSILDTETAGSYQFVVEVTPAPGSGQECWKRDTVNVLISGPPLVDIVASDNNCSGTATLSAQTEGASGDLSYNWVGPGVASGQGTAQISINQSGAYTVTVTDNASGCSSTSEPYTIDLENPLADLKLEAERACGEAYYAVSVQTGYSDSLNIRWYNLANPQQELIEIANQTQVYLEGGNYQAVVSTRNAGCNVKDTAEIELIPVLEPELELQSTYVLCPTFEEMSSDTIQIEGYQLYRWTNLTTGQTIVNETGTFILRAEGKYQLQVNDCEPIPFQVVYDCTPKLFLPNAIIIGGRNDNFRILNERMLANVREFRILIFNRWGQVIWESTDPHFEWRGTSNNGEPVIVGTYAYLITYRNQFGEEQKLQKQQGGITVLK
ncbi:T9SS type B sorting domain-containing protein [Nafulsella turpanensis]|uniref:T9SS type B sorting domain-containing protein n=1 Tax=Nafulsella turpanensis TaxID=1265690 RepID=UPI00034B9532|nr:gliding motility-associated C-terminal domain-containing protein [Nafulsella turpanensis]